MRAEVSALPWRPGAVSSQDRENEGMVCVCVGGGVSHCLFCSCSFSVLMQL